MTKDEIYTAVIEVLTDIQTKSGKALPPLTENTCPLVDLEGFDSYRSVEACFYIARRIGYKLNPSIMFSKNPDKPFQIGEIVEQISQIITKSGSPNGGSRG